MSATADEVRDILKSIDASLLKLVTHFGIGAQGASRAPSGAGTVPAIASDSDLDSKYGNPEVKAKSPRDWSGDSQQGKRFSECPPEYLDLVASRLDYFASQTEGSQDAEEQKKRRYNLIDASRARGWAARLRAGWTAPVEAAGFPSDGAATGDIDDSAIPF